MADRKTTPLSQLFKDPDVRAAFWRAERDHGAAAALGVTADRPRSLDGGEAVAVERELADA
jgi:hypothetical protein